MKVRVKVRPEQRLRFPVICAHCGRAATENMKIGKRKGTTTRLIKIPVCSECYQTVTRKSWAEERWIRLGKVATIGVAFVILVTGFFLLPAEFPGWFRFSSAAILSLLIASGLRGIYLQRSAEMAHREKKAILRSAKITDFSWRITTFFFSRDDFSEHFTDLNQEKIMPGEAS